MKKERKMSKKRSKHIILNSRKEFVKRTLKTGINPINKDEVKLNKEIKAEAKAKLAKVKESRKLRDAKQLEAHLANMTARKERREAIAKIEAEAKKKAREETQYRKGLRDMARAERKLDYLRKKEDKKANKVINLNSRTKRTKIQLKANKALENAV